MTTKSTNNQNAVITDADGIARYEFGSVGEAVIDAMADYAQNDHNRELIRERISIHTAGGGDDWANYYNREKMLAAIANPPSALVEAVDAMRAELTAELAPPTTARRRVRHGQEFGDELDSDRWLVRDLAPWDRNVREMQPKRTVTIGVNLSVSAAQTAEELIYRGAAAVALADIITARGVNVGIVAFWTIEDMSTHCRKVVGKYVVKSPDMPLDLGAVTTALSEIAFARLVGLYGLARLIPGKLAQGLGCVAKLPAQDRRELDYFVDERITSREMAAGWLRKAMAKQESEVAHV
jgi:hypothetical protein